MTIHRDIHGHPRLSDSSRVESVWDQIYQDFTAGEIADILELVADKYRRQGGKVSINPETDHIVVEK